VVAFNREARDWPEGAAQALCCQLFLDLGGEDSIVVATDGSFNAENNRAGWGFLIRLNTTTIEEDAGCHWIYTSSTRMEFEAIQQALLRLSQVDVNGRTIIFATDSMAVLVKIRSGNLPSNWVVFRERHPDCQVIWTYVPGHAGVKINERADTLAGSAVIGNPLQLYSSDVQLLGRYTWTQQTIEQLKEHSEGLRLLDDNISFAHAASSRRKGLTRRVHNQHLTGNISPSSLQLLLMGREFGERISL